MEFRFGVDLITFYHPSFWGAMTVSRSRRSPWGPAPLLGPHRRVGARLAGITGVEVTFPPGDWETAVQTFGSAGGLLGLS